MHELYISDAAIDQFGIKDWFRIDCGAVSMLAEALLTQEATLHNIRTGKEILLAGKYVIGVSADRIEEELNILTEQVDLIRNEKSFDAALRASVFFHMRFEGIHPLNDGNGRVGRTILCAQCAISYRLRFSDLMNGLMENAHRYREVFLSQIPDEERCGLLLDILARVMGMTDPYPDMTLPFSVAPLDTTRIGGRFRFVPKAIV